MFAWINIFLLTFNFQTASEATLCLPALNPALDWTDLRIENHGYCHLQTSWLGKKS